MSASTVPMPCGTAMTLRGFAGPLPGLLDVVFRGLVDMIEDDEQWNGSPADRAKLLTALKRPVNSRPLPQP